MLNINVKALEIGIHELDDDTVLILDDMDRHADGSVAKWQSFTFVSSMGGACATPIADDSFWEQVCGDDAAFTKPTKAYSKAVFMDKYVLKELTARDAKAVLLHEYAHTKMHLDNYDANPAPEYIVQRELEADAWAAKHVGKRSMKRALVKLMSKVEQLNSEYCGMPKKQIRKMGAANAFVAYMLTARKKALA